MGKKLKHTPNSKIKAALHKLFLQSRERGEAIKRDKYTCQCCGGKQSRAKGKEFYVEVHHKEGVKNWQKLYDAVRQYLLTDAENLETLCKECHKEQHEQD